MAAKHSHFSQGKCCCTLSSSSRSLLGISAGSWAQGFLSLPRGKRFLHLPLPARQWVFGQRRQGFPSLLQWLMASIHKRERPEEVNHVLPVPPSTILSTTACMSVSLRDLFSPGSCPTIALISTQGILVERNSSVKVNYCYVRAPTYSQLIF